MRECESSSCVETSEERQVDERHGELMDADPERESQMCPRCAPRPRWKPEL